jgi:hypothetical protein
LIPIWISIISIWFKSYLSLAAIPDMISHLLPFTAAVWEIRGNHITGHMRATLCHEYSMISLWSFLINRIARGIQSNLI